MQKNSLFQENLKRWKPFCPEGAYQISELAEADDSRFRLPEDSEAEAKEWFSGLYLNRIQVIYVYGLGQGYYYEAVRDWLRERDDHCVVFIEDDPLVVYHFLATERCRDLLQDKRAYLYLVSENTALFQLDAISRTFCHYRFVFTGLNSYVQRKPAAYVECRAKMAFFTTMNSMWISESANYGIPFFRNFFTNYLSLPSSYLANGLIGKFEGVPAIICGAGPSLNKNIGVLADLTDRALIFAGGTGLNALNGKGVMPHFGVGIDPNPSQFTRLIMNHAYEIPFLFRARMLHEALEMVHGDRLYLTGSAGYAVAKWMEQKLGIDESEELPEGFNVLTFSTVFAHAMGCNPIICVGIDLAYSQGDSYAEGVISHPIHDRKKNFFTKSAEDEVLSKKDIYGQPIQTLWKWVAESIWYSEFSYKNTDIRLINSTEGGIGFVGVENVPLEEAAQKYLAKQYDWATRLHGEIQNSPLPKSFTESKIKGLIKELEESLARCGEICQKIEELLVKEAGRREDEPSVEGDIKKETSALTQEGAYQSVLQGSCNIFLQGKELAFKQLEIEKESLSEQEHRQKSSMLEAVLYRFLKNTALITSELIQSILREHEEKMEGRPERTSEIPAPAQESGVYHFDNQKFEINEPETKFSYSEEFSLQNPMPSKETSSYPSGAAKTECFYSSDQLLHGPSTFQSEKGAVLARSWFVNGKRQGKMWTYYADGALHGVQQFRNGLKEGRQQFFYQDGLLKSTLSYREGVLDGDVVLYHPEGTLFRKLTFVNGKRTGQEQVWNRQGKLYIEAEYKEDQPVGAARMWHPNGVLAKEIIYDEKSHLAEVKQWDQNGDLVPESKTVDYFEQVNEQTGVLTESLSQMVDKMSVIVPFVLTQVEEPPPLVTQPQKQDDLAADLEALKKEMQRLQSLNQEIKTQFSGEDDGLKEILWKNPATKQQIDQKLDELGKQLSKDVKSIEEGIKQVLSKIVKKKDDKGS